MDRGFGLEIEETYGDTTVATSAFNPAWWSEASEVEFKLNDTPITKRGSSRMNKKVRAGVVKPTGSTTAEADLQRLTWYFLGFLDNYVFTESESDLNTHEFYGGEGKELQSFRAVAVFDMLKKYLYGVLVDGLTLEVSDDSLTVAADYIYKTEKAGIIGVNDTFTRPEELDDDLFIMFYDIALKLNNKSVDGVSTGLTLEGNNNHNVDRTIGFGSRAPQIRAPAQDREVNITLTTTLTNDTVRSILDAEYGAVDALEPSLCRVLQVPLEVTVELCEIPGTELTILFPTASVNVEYNMSGAEAVEVTMNLATLGSGTVTLADEETIVETDMYVKLVNEQPNLLE